MNNIITAVRRALVVAALAFAGMSQAALDPQVNFVELSFEQIGMPAHEAERFTIEPCQGCEAQTVRLTAATVYRISGHGSTPVKFREFREAVRNAKDTNRLLFYVGYAVDTNQVTELVLEAGE